MSTILDARPIAQAEHGSLAGVTTAIYTVQFVMNEDNPREDADHIADFADEIQRVMDEADFTTQLRYDAIDFKVVSRIVVSTVPGEEIT